MKVQKLIEKSLSGFYKVDELKIACGAKAYSRFCKEEGGEVESMNATVKMNLISKDIPIFVDNECDNYGIVVTGYLNGKLVQDIWLRDELVKRR